MTPALPRISHTLIVALLALCGAGTAHAQQAPASEPQPQLGITALAGVHRRFSFAFSETQLGRIAPGAHAAAAAGFSIVSNDGLEVSLPGRLAWRYSNGTDTDVVPWFGLPLYVFEDSRGRHVPWFGVGAGLDLWYVPVARFGLGVNVGLLAVGDGDPTLYGGARVWAAAGFSWRLHEQVSLNLGAGYASNTSDAPTRSLTTDQRAQKLGFGSVLTNGIRTCPALAFELSPALTLGLNARVDYVPEEKFESQGVPVQDAAPPLPDPQGLGGPVGYEAALVVVYTINPR